MSTCADPLLPVEMNVMPAAPIRFPFPTAGRSDMRLLNPGPVNLTPRVRAALNGPDLCHREREYALLHHAVRERLEMVYPAATHDYAAVLLTGSGTAAVEAMLASLVPRDGKALVATNGVYGERMASMLEAHGKSFRVVRSDWLDPVDLDGVARTLETDPTISHVIAVHHETTTGRLNDLAALADVCRPHNVPLLVDAVSSFGGEPIDFRAWNIEACAATANKCLHGVPGAAFVLARETSLTDGTSGAPSVYLDLFRYYQAQQAGYPPFTPAVQSMYALHEALVEMEETGGWQQRHRRYRQLSQRVRDGLCRRGYRLLLSDERYSSVLISFVVPDGIEYDQLESDLKQAGYVIYAGQGSFQNRIFRIAVMGERTDEEIDNLVEQFPRVN